MVAPGLGAGRTTGAPEGDAAGPLEPLGDGVDTVESDGFELGETAAEGRAEAWTEPVGLRLPGWLGDAEADPDADEDPAGNEEASGAGLAPSRARFGGVIRTR